MFNKMSSIALAAALAGCGMGATHASLEEGLSGSDQFNAPGNILISDQFNNRVIEVNPRSGHIVWQWGNGPGDHGPTAAVGVNDAQRVGSLTLLAGTGAPSGTEKPCNKNGCADNRVMLVDRSGAIIWQYGQFGVTGAGPNELNTPVQNTYLPNGNVLIADQGNQRIIEVNPAKQIVWQYGTTGVAGIDVDQLNNPNSAELLNNGNVLISDENNNRAIEVTHTTPSQILATFTAQGTVSGVAFASRLSNGDTLLTDSNNNRIVEVDSGDDVVWQFGTSARAGSHQRSVQPPSHQRQSLWRDCGRLWQHQRPGLRCRQRQGRAERSL
jgi:hypothetical protein